MLFERHLNVIQACMLDIFDGKLDWCFERPGFGGAMLRDKKYGQPSLTREQSWETIALIFEDMHVVQRRHRLQCGRFSDARMD